MELSTLKIKNLNTPSSKNQTIKDMIFSRFGSSRKDIELSASLNNVASDHKLTSKSINEDEDKHDGGYKKPHSMDQLSMQMMCKSTDDRSGLYGYQTQKSVPLPGQLQASNHLQSNLSGGQSAQLHVTHHTPIVQTVHQTQITAYSQSSSTTQHSHSPGRDYVFDRVPGMDKMYHEQVSVQESRVPVMMKHSVQSMQHPASALKTSNQSPQRAQQYMQQPQRFVQQQQHPPQQNIHQPQMHQSPMNLHNSPNSRYQQNVLYNGGPNLVYDQYHQNRQPTSRSQMDVSSASRQLPKNLGIPGQDVYYHYDRENGAVGYEAPHLYPRKDTNNRPDPNAHRRNYEVGVEPKIPPNDVIAKDNKMNSNMLNDSHLAVKPVTLEPNEDTRKYEITVKESPKESTEVNNVDEEQSDIRLKESSTPLSCIAMSKDPVTVRQDPCTSIQNRIEELRKRCKNDGDLEVKKPTKNTPKPDVTKPGVREYSHPVVNGKNPTPTPEERCTTRKEQPILSVNKPIKECENATKDDTDNCARKSRMQHPGSGSDYDKAGHSSSNVDSGRGSAVYSSGRRVQSNDRNLAEEQDAEWVDIVESELRNILLSKDVTSETHSTLSNSESSVTPPLPPLTPQESSKTSRNRFAASLSYGSVPNCEEYIRGSESFQITSNQRSSSTPRMEATKKFNYLFGRNATDINSTATGLDLDSLNKSDSDLSTNDARMIRKQLEGLENMYSEVLKLLGCSTKKRRKSRGLTSYGSVSSLPTSSISSRPRQRHYDKRKNYSVDDRIKKTKDVKTINKRFRRLESHVVTLARSVAHLSSEMRTQHSMIQEMEHIRGEIAALRAQTNMAMIRAQSQTPIKDSELPALSNPSRVKKLTKFFGTEPPLIRLFLRELGYEKYATAFEKEKVGMVELPYLSEDRLQKMGVPLGPRLRILQEARISVYKDPVYVV